MVHRVAKNRTQLKVAQIVKRLPTMRKTWVQSLGREDLLKEMATHSSILAWKTPWTNEPGRLLSMGSQRVRHDFTFTFLIRVKEESEKAGLNLKKQKLRPWYLVPSLHGK